MIVSGAEFIVVLALMCVIRNLRAEISRLAAFPGSVVEEAADKIREAKEEVRITKEYRKWLADQYKEQGTLQCEGDSP
jgi:hypothetical protein